MQDPIFMCLQFLSNLFHPNCSKPTSPQRKPTNINAMLLNADPFLHMGRGMLFKRKCFSWGGLSRPPVKPYRYFIAKASSSIPPGLCPCLPFQHCTPLSNHTRWPFPEQAKRLQINPNKPPDTAFRCSNTKTQT